MHVEIIAENTGLPTSDVRGLLSYGARIYEEDAFNTLVDGIDVKVLQKNIAAVRAIYDEHLPELVDILRTSQGYTGNAMSSITLSNWVLGFLANRSQISKLQGFHEHLPKEIFVAGFPHIIKILDNLGSGGTEWKKAISILSMPLLAA